MKVIPTIAIELSDSVSMGDRSEAVHVHRGDARQVIKEYRQKGYVLKERTKPTIATQDGFVKLIFIPAEDAPVTSPVEATHERHLKRRSLFSWKLWA